MNKLNKILTGGLVGLVAGCGPMDKPNPNDWRYTSDVHIGNEIAISDIDNDGDADVIYKECQRNAPEVPKYALFVTPDALDSAEARFDLVTRSLPMTPELQDAATRAMKSLRETDYLMELTRYNAQEKQ